MNKTNKQPESWTCDACGVERMNIHAKCTTNDDRNVCAKCSHSFFIVRVENALIRDWFRTVGESLPLHIEDLTHEVAVSHAKNMRDAQGKAIAFLVAECRLMIEQNDISAAMKSLARIEKWVNPGIG